MSGIKRRAIESPGASIPIPGGLKLRPVKNWGTFYTEIGGGTSIHSIFRWHSLAL